MRCQPLLRAILIGLAFVTPSGCDPGYEMRPAGVVLEPNGTWAASLLEVVLVGRPLRGLVGEESLDIEFQATNPTNKDLQIDEAVLLVGGQSMPMVREQIDPGYWIVPAGAKDHPVLLVWDFEDSTAQVLGSECLVIISAHRDSKRGTLRIRYARKNWGRGQ